tara:strand:+ start:1279 stop:1923 length:645 start_codon:yes stop_codon:yes gene_type:complete
MEVKLKIPTTLNEITLGQYIEFSKLDIKKESEIQSKMIEIFCEVPSIVVRNMKATDIVDICNILNNMFDTKHQLINSFKIGKQEYSFIPSLEDMSFGEYVDLDTFIGDNDNLHRAMNVLYRPIDLKQGDRYKIKDYDPDLSEDAKNYPLDAVLGAIVFFYDLGKDLSTVMLNFSKEANEENLVHYLTSLPNGAGTIQSMDSLTEILQGLKISLN